MTVAEMIDMVRALFTIFEPETDERTERRHREMLAEIQRIREARP